MSLGYAAQLRPQGGCQPPDDSQRPEQAARCALVLAPCLNWLLFAVTALT